MGNRNSRNVIIIKRPKVVEGGHHGGAWKVAYADFVTAMMAFFLLMWLLSVTDDKTRLGLADYFSPTIPIHSTRGGGDGPFAGSSMFSQDILARDETGRESAPGLREGRPADRTAGDDALTELANELKGASGDAVEADPLLAHIRTRITDEGLIIDVFDVAGSPLFVADAAAPNAILERLLGMIGRVLARTGNPVAVTGHLAGADARPGGPDPWTLSGDRAQFARAALVAAGVADARLQRVTGKADRSPAAPDAGDARNRRIEITLLRSFD